MSDEFLDAAGHARSYHEVARCFLLQHPPHCLDVVPGETPIATGGEIPQLQLVVQSKFDSSDGPCDLSCDEFCPAAR